MAKTTTTKKTAAKKTASKKTAAKKTAAKKTAKKTSSRSKAKKPLYEKDQVLVFNGYDDLPEDQDEIMSGDTYVRVLSVDPKSTDKFKVESMSEYDEDEEALADTVFASELRTLTDEEEEEVAAFEAESDAEEEGEEEEAEEEEEEETPKPAKKSAKKSGKKSTSKKAAKKTAAKREKVEEPKEEVILMDSTTALLEEYEGDAVEAAKVAERRADENYYDFGGLLAHIAANDLHTLVADKKGNPLYEAGNKGFRVFVEDNFGTDTRTAYYLMGIYRNFSKLGKDAADFADIGWSKLKELVPAIEEGGINKRNVNKALKFAREHTRDEVVEHMAVEYLPKDKEGNSPRKKDKVPTTKRVTRKFQLIEDQDAAVETALEAASEKIGEDATPEKALVHITTEWGMQSEVEGAPLADVLATLAVSYGEEELQAAVEEYYEVELG